jgi:putative restriction endonuclease
MTAPSTDREVLERFSKISVWKRGGERAPHKPLLILYALARLQSGEPRPLRFEYLDEDPGRHRA